MKIIENQPRHNQEMEPQILNGLQQTTTTLSSSSSSSSSSSAKTTTTTPTTNNNNNNNNSNTATCGEMEEEELDDDNRTNLIVNYLPQTMSQDDIRSLFSTIGEIDSCKLIRDKTTGQSLGYGFVNYKYPEHARKAIDALNGLRLQTKTIKVSVARPSSDTIKGANLYVSGLSKTMTQTDVDKLFQSYGKIVTSRLLCDPQTGLSKGVGFVRYETRLEAEHAIKHLNGTVPAGTTDPVTVKFANCPNSTSKMNNVLSGGIPQSVTSYLTTPTSRRYMSGGVTTLPTTTHLRYTAAAALDGTALTLPGSGVITAGSLISGCGWCLFVYNLAPETEENVLWQLFGPFGAVQNVRVIRDLSTQKCKGFGFVTMTNYKEALSAVTSLNGYQLGSRVLQVSFKKTKTAFSSSPGVPGFIPSL